jgi:pimeloyl-ACP methyl ester carboxylesterase
MSMKGTIRLSSLVLFALLGSGFAGCSKPSASPTDVAFTACRLKGIEIALRCANIAVPEDRERGSDSSARKIAIHLAVIPALARKPERDAIFVLAGGPGQSATDLAGSLYSLLSKLGRDRDVVLVDQRGTGGSNPLSCSEETATQGIGDEFDPKDIDARIAHCAKRLSAKADLTRYTTTIAMQDLDEVRARLGYRQIDLWGGSYGTRAALEYVRQFPDRVRTMTLDGVAPAWQKLPISFGVDTYATLVALVDSCSHDVVCAKRYPDLGADITGLLTRLDAKGIPTDITNPATGKKQHITVTRTGFAQLLRTPLYIGLTASLLPAALEQASHDNFDALAALTFTISDGLDDRLALGMHLSVICSEDVPAISADDLAAARAEAAKSVVDGRPNVFASIYAEHYRKLCSNWPSRPQPTAYFETLAGKPGAKVPTLLLSGGIDPATPPAHAESVARAMTNAKHLIATGVGHGVSLQGCAPDLIERFIKSADPKAIDGSCLTSLPRPLFFAPIVEGRREKDPVALP